MSASRPRSVLRFLGVRPRRALRSTCRRWRALARSRGRWALVRGRRFLASPRGRRFLVASAFAAIVALLAWLVWLDARPRVRIVNATNHPLTFRVDGRAKVYEVPPTSTETPEGGVTIRLTPGFHLFTISHSTHGSEPVSIERPTSLAPYENYLLAGATDGQCFFVQRTAYGSARASGRPETSLDPERYFWPLPRVVDAFFSPNPPPLPGDRWSTGGERVALRQRRCDAPPTK